MLTLILEGLATVAALIALVLGIGFASVAALFAGSFLTLMLAGFSTAKIVDDPYQ